TPTNEGVFIQSWGTTAQTGTFQKQVVWTRQGAERCLIADCMFWLVQSDYVPPPDGMIGQGDFSNSGANFFVQGSTTIDAYRHGKYPGKSGQQFKLQGGKVAFNMLFVDGHVGGAVDRRDAFRATRMRYPQ